LDQKDAAGQSKIHNVTREDIIMNKKGVNNNKTELLKSQVYLRTNTPVNITFRVYNGSSQWSFLLVTSSANYNYVLYDYNYKLNSSTTHTKPKEKLTTVQH